VTFPASWSWPDDLWLGPTAGPRLVGYVPLDDESRARLEKLQALVLAEV
jgi:hypothetical protein